LIKCGKQRGSGGISPGVFLFKNSTTGKIITGKTFLLFIDIGLSGNFHKFSV
jgi:hypothetical protein